MKEEDEWSPETKLYGPPWFLHALKSLHINWEYYLQAVCEVLAHYTLFKQSHGH